MSKKKWKKAKVKNFIPGKHWELGLNNLDSDHDKQ